MMSSFYGVPIGCLPHVHLEVYSLPCVLLNLGVTAVIYVSKVAPLVSLDTSLLGEHL